MGPSTRIAVIYKIIVYAVQRILIPSIFRLMYEREVTGNYSIRARNLFFFSASLDSGRYNRQFTDTARLVWSQLQLK